MLVKDDSKWILRNLKMNYGAGSFCHRINKSKIWSYVNYINSWLKLVSFLIRLRAELKGGQIVLISSNLFDKAYLEYDTSSILLIR